MLRAIILSLSGVIPHRHLAIDIPLIILIGVYLVINTIRLQWVRTYTRRHGAPPGVAGTHAAS
jgi:hypothetical protein